MSTTVVCISPITSDIEAYLKEGFSDDSIKIIQPIKDDRTDLLKCVSNADVLIGWNSDLEILKAAVKLKLFINPSTGVSQHIENFRSIKNDRDIVLVNGHGHAYAVAQHCVSLLLSLSNAIVPHHHKMANRLITKPPQRNFILKDITIGFLGYGAINRQVHKMLSGFEVKFAACKRSWSTEELSPPTNLKCYKADQIDKCFITSDVVINALPYTSMTHQLIGKKHFESLGNKGLFINIGRGSTVVEKALFNALETKTIAAAALDVWWPQPKEERIEGLFQPFKLPFHELKNLVMSPHRAADNPDSLERWDEVIENINCLHEGRSDFSNIVNLDLEY